MRVMLVRSSHITIAGREFKFRLDNVLAHLYGGRQFRTHQAVHGTYRRIGALEIIGSFFVVDFRCHANVRDILQVTQLITVFDVFDNEEEAIAAFS